MIGGGRKSPDPAAGGISENSVSYTRIIVPVHGTKSDKKAIELAGMLGSGKDTDLVLVYVVEVAQSLPLEADLPGDASSGESVLAQAEAWARSASDGRIGRVRAELLQARSAGAAIVDEAIERGADVIVMALRQHMRHGQPTRGSTVPYVLENAPCEVVVNRLPAVDCAE